MSRSSCVSFVEQLIIDCIVSQKPTIWARPNKGVEARMMRDIEDEAVGKPTLETARAILERKSKVYEKLRKGKSGGLNDKQYDALLVDVREFCSTWLEVWRAKG